MTEAAREPPLLSVIRNRDGVWSVNERTASRVAVAYFPSKWGAIRHAVRSAMARRRCRVALIEPDGAIRVQRDYERGPASEVEE